MECRDVRELADSFLSEQLLVETTHDILRHLSQCPSCRAEIESRRRLRTALRGAFERSPELRATPRSILSPVASGGATKRVNRSTVETTWIQ